METPARLAWTAAAMLTLVAVAPRAARAQDSPPPPSASASSGGGFAPMAPAGGGFGTIGQWVFTFETADSGSGLFFFHKASGGDSSVTLNPGADYFITGNVSLGGSVTFAYQSCDTCSTTIGVGPRAGYNLTITDKIGFWPSARFFLQYDNGNHTSQTTTTFAVFAPFLVHVTPHFFLGAGPDINIGLSGGGGTEYGIDFVIGGWL